MLKWNNFFKAEVNAKVVNLRQGKNFRFDANLDIPIEEKQYDC